VWSGQPIASPELENRFVDRKNEREKSGMTSSAATTSQNPLVEVPLPIDTTPRKQDDALSISSLKSTPIQNDYNAAEDPYMPTDEAILPSSLPPVDGGRQAWAYLLCATILETLVWGEF
jgi:hypothetical protein